MEWTFCLLLSLKCIPSAVLGRVWLVAIFSCSSGFKNTLFGCLGTFHSYLARILKYCWDRLRRDVQIDRFHRNRLQRVQIEDGRVTGAFTDTEGETTPF
jgi:hypothetical protein